MNEPEDSFDLDAGADDAPAAPVSATPAVPFDPVALRTRTDGWTAQRQRAFIEALADTGSVEMAAEQAGVSVQSAYRLRRKPEAAAFELAWRSAMAHAANRLVDVAFDRALNGTVDDIYYHGEKVGERRRYSDRLLLAMLNYNDQFYFSPTEECPDNDEDYQLLPDLRRVIAGSFSRLARMIAPEDPAQVATPGRGKARRAKG